MTTHRATLKEGDKVLLQDVRFGVAAIDSKGIHCKGYVITTRTSSLVEGKIPVG